MGEVDRELDRLIRGWRATRGRTFVAYGHLLLLVVAVLVALASRLFGVFPALDALRDRYVLVLAVALGLLALGPVLSLLVPRLLRVERRRFARGLDDRLAWHDALDTSLDVAPRDRPRSVETFLLAQSAGRLRGLEPRRLWPRWGVWRWIPRILALLFAALILLPGMDGSLGQRGTGAGTPPGLGVVPEDAPGLPPPIDVWMVTHVREPLLAEPLEAEPLPEEGER